MPKTALKSDKICPIFGLFTKKIVFSKCNIILLLSGEDQGRTQDFIWRGGGAKPIGGGGRTQIFFKFDPPKSGLPSPNPIFF